jgi:hypothetical protein
LGTAILPLYLKGCTGHILKKSIRVLLSFFMKRRMAERPCGREAAVEKRPEKRRSAKILRGTIKKIADSIPYTMLRPLMTP